MNEITYEQRVQTYTNALITFGKTKQCIVAIEELSECAKEICKVLRGDGNMDHFAEEIADATICLEQMRLMFNLNEPVCRKMDEKILRLDGKLRSGAFGVDRTVSGLTSED